MRCGRQGKNNMPVLEEEDKVCTSDLERAKLCEAKFKSLYSLGEEGVRKSNETVAIFFILIFNCQALNQQ